MLGTPDRRHTASVKWQRYAGRDVLPLWVADMDYAAPEPVLAALHARIDHGVFGYTLPPASTIDAVLDYVQSQFGWTIHPEWLVWLPGVVPGLNLACRAVGQAGDGVLSFTPIYPPFLTAPGHSERQLQPVPLAQGETRWEMDLEAFDAAVTPRSRTLLFCHPHNPVGRAWTVAELRALAERCQRHDLIVLSDEIHAELQLVPGARHTPLVVAAPELAERSITLLGPTKAYNLPGLYCAYAIIPNSLLRRRFHQAMAGLVSPVNTLGYVGLEAAYRHGQPWLEAVLTQLRANHEQVQAALGALPGLRLTPVEATYLAWLDCRARGLADAHAFFEAAGVGLSNGADFGLPGFVRLNFACTEAVLTEALARMHRALHTER